MSAIGRMFYRIPFSETDAMGIVHHSNHPRYMERGRVEFLRHAEMGYAEVIKAGVHFPVIEMGVKYRAPIVFDQVIVVETEVSKLTKTRLSFSYKIFTTDKIQEDGIFSEQWEGSPVLMGETHHCSVNSMGRPVEMPTQIFQKLSSMFQGAQE